MMVPQVVIQLPLTCHTVDIRRRPLNVTVYGIEVLYGRGIQILAIGIALIRLGQQPGQHLLNAMLVSQPTQTLDQVTYGNQYKKYAQQQQYQMLGVFYAVDLGFKWLILVVGCKGKVVDYKLHKFKLFLINYNNIQPYMFNSTL